MVEPKDQLKRCMICTHRESLIRFRQMEMCFDCALESIEPISCKHTVALELFFNHESGESDEGFYPHKGYNQGEFEDGEKVVEQMLLDLEVDNGAW